MIKPKPFKATVVRASKPGWAYAPTSGEGAAKHGGRFNPKGVAALYTSLSFDTCAREVRFTFNTDPYTFYYLTVSSPLIIDLTDPAIRKKLKVGWNELACPNWESEMHRGVVPASHRVATRLIDAGYHGILVPSFAPNAAPEDVNLVLWRWTSDDQSQAGDQTAARVEVINREALPKDRASWT